MEDQSHNISSSHGAPEPDMDDILDLTGGQYARKVEVDEDEEDRRSYSDSLEPSPESEEPSSVGSDLPPPPPRGPLPVIPTAPIEEEHDIPTSPYGPPTTTTGSVGRTFLAQFLRTEDVNLFPLPASPAPLMQSSADNVMDLQHPSSTAPAGKEDLSSLLFESTTTLPSLSPLSPDYPKEHTATIAFSADSTTPEALQRYSTATDYSEGKDYKYTFGLGGVEDVIFSDRGYAVEHPTSQLESASVDQAKLYTQSAKEMFSGMLQSVGPPHEAFSDLKEAVDEHYADFKPLVSTVGYDFKDMALDFKSDVSHLNFESIKPEGKYIEEKDLDLSDDISPASPDAISNSSSYETLAPLQKAAPLAYGGNPFTDNKSEKGVDGTETCSTSHLGSNVATVNPFLERIDKEAGYITSSNESGIVGAQASSKAEGLTPDIVQEAYESEVYDLGIPKLNYEPKIDLVQTTAKASQEIAPPTQNSPLFEDSNSVSSPVLPDIVMEAPLTSASQPNFSPAGHVGVVSEEKIKFESEKPPSYEDATNKSSLKEQVTTVAHVEPVKGVQAVEAEAPYISIACDLIKETIPEKVTDFSKALKNEFDSQYTAHYDESSPESEPSEPSYKHWKAEVISKEEVASIGNMKSHDIFEKDQESDQEEAVNKAYVETGSGFFESNLLAKEPVAQISSSQEKPLQMEAFGKTLYFEEVPPFREPVIFEKMTSKKEQESDQKWPEEVVHKAYAETASYGFDKNMLAKEPVKPLSSQEKPLQMEAFGKAVFSEGAPPATEPVHFEKPSAVSFVQEFSKPSKEDQVEVKKQEDLVPKDEPKKTEDLQQKAKESPPASDKLLDFSKGKSEIEDTISKPAPPTKGADVISSSTDKKQPPAPPALGVCSYKTSVVDLLYWRDIKKSGLVFGASLFLLLSLTVFSIVSVSAYIALALLSVTISFRIYKGVLQAIQKSEEGHPFKCCLDSNVAVSEELVNKYSNVALGHVNCTLKELRRLFLVEDLVDSLKFAVLMWVFTYIGALFNGLTLLILALISLFSIPVIYERHQTQVDHYIALISKNFNNVKDLILAKVPGMKRKAD